MGTASCWAEMAAKAHHLSQSSSSYASSPASVSTTCDREVVVCLNDRLQVSEYRRKISADIVKHANKIRAKAAKSNSAVTLASVMVLAACQLKSGDVRLMMRSAKEAEVMRVHQEKWVKKFGRIAFVHMPTWGVVINGIQVKSLVERPTIEALREMQKQKGDAMIAANQPYWKEAVIARIGWLRLPQDTKKLASLIIEFTVPQAAKLAIQHGTLWDSNHYATVLYDRTFRLRQCYNCQQYGHIGPGCVESPRCVYCAGAHQSRDCASRTNEQGHDRCANCEGTHTAWSEDCEVRMDAIAKAWKLSKHRGVFHRVPASFSLNDPSLHLSPSTASSFGTLRYSSSEEGSASTPTS